MPVTESKRSVFVTVGSTSFDDLIQSVCSEECLELLKLCGFEEIVLQIGKGTFIPEEKPSLKIEWFRFKDDISENFKKASLVIGHAGAGTILESLSEGKPLIVVLNEKLMDNHQSELAEKLSDEGCLKYCSCSQLLDTINECNSSEFKKPSFIFESDVFMENLEHILALR